MKLRLVRENTIHVVDAESFTPGKLYADGLFLGFTCEDADRQLEKVGVKEKVYGRTAIPRGRYGVEVSYSHRFRKLLPSVMDVPGFSGIRVHGGNTAENSLGCILLGKVRTSTGIAQCADTVKRLIAMIQACEDRAEVVQMVIE